MAQLWTWLAFSIILFILPPCHLAFLQQVELAFTTAPLLSGGLTGCVNATSSTCKGGLASAAAYLRNWKAEGRRQLFLPKLEHSTIFVQMAEPQWSVNIPIMQRLGFSHYFAEESVLGDCRPANEGLLQTEVMFTMANVYVPPSHKWYGYTTRFFYQDRIVIIPLGDESQPNCYQVIDSVRGAVVDAWRRYKGKLDLTVVLHRTSSNVNQFAAAVEQMDVPPDIVLVQQPPSDFVFGLRNRTYFLRFDLVDSIITRATVQYTNDNGVHTAIISAAVDNISLSALPPEYEDDTYWADQQYLQQLAAQALAHNPILGTSTAPMPLTRSGQSNVCLAGECPLGDMFADALHWKLSSDVGIISSGGLRGPGWPAGPIRVSDVWASLPFANTLCKAQVLGLTLWNIFNHSMALATFQSQITPTGDRLLQVSGVRVYYNPTLDPIEGRVTGIEVLDGSKGKYVPLERLKLYTMAADSFVCSSFDTFPELLAGQYAGETKVTIQDGTVQETLAQYLQAIGSFTPDISDRLIVNESGVSLLWLNTLASCPINTMFDASIATCMPCPIGMYQPIPGQTTCITAPAKSFPLLYVLVPILGGTVVLSLVVLFYVFRRASRNARDLRYAPISGCATILFTDIQDSTRLWGMTPQCMALSLDHHHRIIRKCILRHKGYEVKTLGDSFMIAVTSPQAAVAIAIDIQLALQKQPFPQAIFDMYSNVDLASIRDDTTAMAQIHPLWNGLRVRMGIHTGSPDCVLDKVTNAYDYYGPCVNIAARVESMASGGQILVTEDVVSGLSLDYGKVAMRCLGSLNLRGVQQPMVLYELLPMLLIERRLVYEVAKMNESQEENQCSFETTSETATVLGITSQTVAEQVASHPLVQNRLMTLEEMDNALQSMSQTLTAVLRQLPLKEGESIIKMLAKAWRVTSRSPWGTAIQLIALRALPSMPKYRRLSVQSSKGRAPTSPQEPQSTVMLSRHESSFAVRVTNRIHPLLETPTSPLCGSPTISQSSLLVTPVRQDNVF